MSYETSHVAFVLGPQDIAGTCFDSLLDRQTSTAKRQPGLLTPAEGDLHEQLRRYSYLMQDRPLCPLEKEYSPSIWPGKQLRIYGILILCAYMEDV